MNYIELINDFWSYCEENEVSTSEKVTYFAILNYCNKLNWKNPFYADWSVLVQYSGISKNSHYSALQSLHDKKIIRYQKGEKNKLKAFVFILKIENKTENKTKNNIENNFENKTENKIENLIKQENNKTIKHINNIEERKLKFAETLKPFVGKYTREFIKDFYEYWTEPNKSNTKFKQELLPTWSLERRLSTWAKNENKFNSYKNGKSKTELENEQLTIRERAERIVANRRKLAGDEEQPNFEEISFVDVSSEPTINGERKRSYRINPNDFQ